MNRSIDTQRLKQTRYTLEKHLADLRDTKSPIRIGINTENNFFSPRNLSAKGKLCSTPQSKTVSRLAGNINVGEVTRAAKPNYVGTTPDYKLSPPIKFKGGMTSKQKTANSRSKSLLTAGVFKIPEKFEVDNKDQRRIWPIEYRGPNLSNCMYTTATSFHDSRKHMMPLKKEDPDFNYQIGGGQTN
jgi:hypothetical protein